MTIQEIREAEIKYCSEDVTYFVLNYGHIEDRDSEEVIQPFKLWNEQIEALKARLKRKNSSIEFYKQYLTDQFVAVGKKVLETPRNSVSFRPSEQVIVDDRFIELNCNNPAFVKTETTQTPIKANIKKAIKSGDTVLGASLQTVENIQIK